VPDSPTHTQTLSNELSVLEAAIAKNAKAYCLWTHRLWVIDRLVEQGDEEVLRNELALCAKFLKMDERNFHCW
jgi:geranylgeranyl transferase type-2 subunit alpha